MKKHHLLPAILFIILLSGLQSSIAQNIAINSTGAMPDDSAMLDVASTAKGLLIPRITLASLSDVATIPNPANSLLVYNNVATYVPVGYYYNTGTTTAAVWVKLSTADVLAVTAIGATANANGASVSGSNLTLQPADATNGGVVTSGTQTFGGMKTFKDDMKPAGRLMIPMGELSYFNTTGTLTSLPSQSNGTTNLVKVSPTTALTTGSFEFDNNGTNTGTLRYTGATTRYFHIAVTLSSTPSTASDVFVFVIYKNGAPENTSKVMGSSSGTQFSALHVFLSLAPNNTLELYIGNMTSGRNVTIKSFNMFALGM